MIEDHAQAPEHDQKPNPRWTTLPDCDKVIYIYLYIVIYANVMCNVPAVVPPLLREGGEGQARALRRA